MSTPTLKHLLIATDGSECSEKAVWVGLQLASRLRAKVTLLNVVEYGQEPADAGLPTRFTQLHNIERHHGKLALEQASALAQQLGVAFKTLQPTGWPEQVIVREAQAFDLVVMGTHGHSGIRRWIMGSVAEAVLAKRPKPVLVVHESHTPKQVPEAASFKQLLIATDGSECSAKASDLGLKLAQTLKAEVTFLQVVSHISRQPGSALPLAEAQGLIEKDMQTQAEKVLAQALEQAKVSGVTARSKLMQGKPAEYILKLAQIHDLVVMGTHGRTGVDKLMLGSVAEGVIRRSRPRYWWCRVLNSTKRGGLWFKPGKR